MYTYQMTGKTVLWDANSSVYQIPDFQREYSWGISNDGSPEVHEFWDDIFEDCWKRGRNQLAGEYGAELKIHGLGTVLQVRVKVDSKGNVKLAEKYFLHGPPG
jgi:hypothetical protein